MNLRENWVKTAPDEPAWMCAESEGADTQLPLRKMMNKFFRLVISTEILGV